MRKTGSRESRDSRDASATSPFSIAVKTFSIRFGSRRIQRPSHQKMRSSTTVKRDDGDDQDRPHDRAALSKFQ